MNKLKLLILCADGLDYEYAKGSTVLKMPYEYKLNVDDELCVDFEGKRYPHTLIIWPSILAGRFIETKIPPINENRNKFRMKIRRGIKQLGINWKRKEQEKNFTICPLNHGLETMGVKYNSIIWNIPTISPEFVWGYPSTKLGINYMQREYEIFKLITRGMISYKYQLSIAYFRILDMYAHLKMSKAYEFILLDLDQHIKYLQSLDQNICIILVTDHAASPIDGDHHNYAYLGCNNPVKASSLLEIRSEVERLLESS